MGEHLSPTTFYGYQVQGAQGAVATGSHLPFGTGSGEIDKQSNNSKVRPIGQAALKFIKGGGAATLSQFTFDSIHSAAPLLLFSRTAGLLPWFTISGGHNEATDVGFHCRDNKANTLALKLSAGDQPGLLSGSMTMIGHRCVENTTAEVIADLSVTQFMAYEAIATLGGVGVELSDFDLTGNNNLKPTWVIKGSARSANEARFWDYLTEGVLDLSGSLGRLEPWSGDVHADVVTSSDLVILLTNKVSGEIIRLTSTDATFDSSKQSTPRDGAQSYGLPFTAKNLTIATV